MHVAAWGWAYLRAEIADAVDNWQFGDAHVHRRVHVAVVAVERLGNGHRLCKRKVRKSCRGHSGCMAPCGGQKRNWQKHPKTLKNVVIITLVKQGEHDFWFVCDPNGEDGRVLREVLVRDFKRLPIVSAHDVDLVRVHGEARRALKIGKKVAEAPSDFAARRLERHKLAQHALEVVQVHVALLLVHQGAVARLGTSCHIVVTGFVDAPASAWAIVFFVRLQTQK